jgi:hypothetical protein
MVPGAVHEGIGDFLIWEFDHSVSIHTGVTFHTVLLSGPIALMLDSAANQLICRSILNKSRDSYFPDGGTFCYLSRHDRLVTLSYLEQLKIDLGDLPEPFRYNGNWIKLTVDLINRHTMFGYYSEWSGYGSTRLLPPDYRKLEYTPVSWEQIDYPGPTLT